MELRVLRYFLMVVDERNISRAAEKLHVSQPTVSRQLRDMEEELGVTLFERGSRTIALTTAGDYVYQQARQIVALADKTVANVQRTDEISGSVMIGCAEALMMTTVTKAVARLQTTAPGVSAALYSADATDVHARLQAGVFDFGVVMEPMAKDDCHFLNLPGKTDWGVLVRRDAPLAAKAAVTVADLQGVRVIAPQQHGSIALLTDWLGASDRQLQIVATYNLLYNASLMVQAGVGVALGLDGIINTADSDLRFVPLTPRLPGHASLIWAKSRPLSPAANAFLEALQAQLA